MCSFQTFHIPEKFKKGIQQVYYLFMLLPAEGWGHIAFHCDIMFCLPSADFTYRMRKLESLNLVIFLASEIFFDDWSLRLARLIG